MNKQPFMATETYEPRDDVTKQDVARNLANALMGLGKNDWNRVRHYIESARRDLEDYIVSDTRVREKERQNKGKL